MRYSFSYHAGREIVWLQGVVGHVVSLIQKTEEDYNSYLNRPDGGAYEKEKAPLVDADLGQYGDTLYGITVGSEGIYRGTYSEGDLMGWISDMQQTFPDVVLGTADSWNGWANGTMDNIITSGIKLM